VFDTINRFDSSDTNVSKFVFSAKDAVAEAVLYKYNSYEQRTVICCSVMSGCPIGCAFCGSGNYFVRKLTSDEIVQQVESCLAHTGVDPLSIQKFQIMTMSMGEPMLNMTNLIEALTVLGARYPNAALLVSTMAPNVDYGPFLAFAESNSKVGLQFSIHESTDAARNKIIPFRNKLELVQIADIGEQFYQCTGRKPYINYCIHPNNSSIDDVNRLVELFDPRVFCATVSVICEQDETIAQANARQLIMATEFSGQMVSAGYNTRVFNPAGTDDIGGGCGQLWFVQDWMKNNPSLTHKSCGYGLTKIHPA